MRPLTLIMTAAALVAAIPALADRSDNPDHRGGRGGSAYGRGRGGPAAPVRQAPGQYRREAPVIRPEPRRPGHVVTNPGSRRGPVVVTPGRGRYHPPVVVNPRVVIRRDRVFYPRHQRSWVYRPEIIVIRPYYWDHMRPLTLPVIREDYHRTIEQGELWPSNTDQLSYFTHYTFSIERSTIFDRFGYSRSEDTISLYPQIICQDRVDYNCADVVTPPVSRLVVNSQWTDSCGILRISATAPYDATDSMPVQRIELTDYSRFNCDYHNGTRDELDATITHLEGYTEGNLTGNRTL